MDTLYSGIIIKKILKHLGLWEVNPVPPARNAKSQLLSTEPVSIIRTRMSALPIAFFMSTCLRATHRQARNVRRITLSEIEPDMRHAG